MSQVSKDLADSIKGADLKTLQADADEESDADSFPDLVDDIVSGNTTAEKVDERLDALLNDLIDIPYVHEAIEGKLLDFTTDGIKAALVQVAYRVS